MSESLAPDPDPPRAHRGDVILVADPTAEGETLSSALRARGYHVIDVELAELESRTIAEGPRALVVDVDQDGSLELVERMRDTGISGDAIVFCIAKARMPDLLSTQIDQRWFDRPVDLELFAASVAEIAEPQRRFLRRTAPPSYPPRRETSPPIRRDSEAPPSFTSGLDPFELGSILQEDDAGKLAAPDVSPELQQVLDAAEARINATAQPVSGPPGEPDVDLILAPELLTALEEPIEPEDEDHGTGSGLQTGTPHQHTRGATTGAATGTGTLAHALGTGAGLATIAGVPAAISEPSAAPERSRTGQRHVELFEPALHAIAGVEDDHVPPRPRAQTLVDDGAGLFARQAAQPIEASRLDATRAKTSPGLEEAIGLRRQEHYVPPMPPFPMFDGGEGGGAGDQRETAPPPTRRPLTRSSDLAPPPPSVQTDEIPRVERVVAVRHAAVNETKKRTAEPEAPPLPAVLGEGDALRALATAIARRLSGSLALGNEPAVRRIVLHEGDVVTAGSSAHDESLVAFLASRGDLERDVATRLSSKLPPFGRHAGAALIANGHLKQDDLWPVLRAHAEWVIGRTIELDEGACELEAEPPGRLRAEPNVFGGATGAEVLVETVRRMLPPDTARKKLGGREARLDEGSRFALLAECALRPNEEELVRGARGKQVGEVVGDGEPELANVLLALAALGVIDVLAPARAGGDEAKSSFDPLDEEALRQRIRARYAIVEDGDYFAVLGIPRSATGYEVRRAYLELRRAFEPARVLTAATADLAEQVRTVVEVLDEAYEILKDAHRRDRYRKAIEAGPP